MIRFRLDGNNMACVCLSVASLLAFLDFVTQPTNNLPLLAKP